MSGTFHYLAALCWLSGAVRPTPVIEAPWGKVQGVRVEGVGGRTMSGYLGIPFALPPTGPLRWQRPRPHPGPGPGNVFQATQLKPACPQETDAFGVYNGTSEDCLTLNVFVPLVAERVPSHLAVMVFIHGGAFHVEDAATYRPTKLVADGGVITVTIQYRLGTLGFLATGDDLVKGNFGLWDQTLALRWVKDNIRAFGGDPERITVFGESAGSNTASLLTLSPHAKGLVRRVIMQSGAPNMIKGFRTDDATNVRLLSRELDCERDSSADMVDCLRTRSADDIVKATGALIRRKGSIVLFLPTVDGDWLPRDPLELMRDERYVQEMGVGAVDHVIGVNNQEGAMLFISILFMAAPSQTVNDPGFFRAVLDACVKVTTGGMRDHTMEKIVEFFYRGADMGTNRSVPTDAATQLYGDAVFNAPTVEWIRTLVSQPHTGSVYMYLFDHNFQFNENGLAPGSHHGDELFTEFELLMHSDHLYSRMNKTGLAREEEHLSDLFVTALTSFAKTGNPNTDLKDKLGFDWPEFTRQDEAYLAMSLTPRVQRDLYKSRMALWLDLLPQVASATQRPQKPQPDERTGKDEL